MFFFFDLFLCLVFLFFVFSLSLSVIVPLCFALISLSLFLAMNFPIFIFHVYVSLFPPSFILFVCPMFLFAHFLSWCDTHTSDVCLYIYIYIYIFCFSFSLSRPFFQYFVWQSLRPCKYFSMLSSFMISQISFFCCIFTDSIFSQSRQFPLCIFLVGTFSCFYAPCLFILIPSFKYWCLSVFLYIGLFQ